MESRNAIELEGLRCGYRGRVILDIPRLTVATGEFIAVIGPNGSGKTTLARLLSGVIAPYRGSVRLDGVDIARLSRRARARALAVVNQTVEAGDLTVEDYVLMGRVPNRPLTRFFETAAEVAIARESARLVGLEASGDTPVSRLSGGERQLAAIARALAQQSGILVLDEPTAHLDIAHQVKILDLARHLNRAQGITVVLIIHDLNLAGEYSDRLVLLDRGTPFASGTPAEVLTPGRVESVYGTRVVIYPDPLSGRPRVFPVPGEFIQKEG